ncbi:helix-turn-helix domain-containing protein [Pseudomonas silesiensis]
MEEFLRSRQLTLESLTSEELITLIGEMDKSGVFEMRNSINYVCELLTLSRATVYKYLRLSKAADGE